MYAIGSYLMIIGFAITAWQYFAIHGKEVADGKVTALEAYTSSNSRGGSTDRLLASFSDRSGATHTYRAAFGSISTGYQVGDTIRIYFDRDNPADCGVLSFGYRFGIGWGFIAAGFALWLFMGGVTVGNRWLEDLFPTTAPLVEQHQMGGSTR